MADEQKDPKMMEADARAADDIAAEERKKKAEQAVKNIHALAQFGVLALSTEEGKAAIKKAQDEVMKRREAKDEMAKGVTDAIVGLAMYAYDLVATRVTEDLDAAFRKIQAEEVTTEKLSNAMVEVCGGDLRKILFAKDCFVRIAVQVFGADVMKRLDAKAKEELMRQREEANAAKAQQGTDLEMVPKDATPMRSETDGSVEMQRKCCCGGSCGCHK